ncbi:MAG TPA: hypothetical protein VG297_02195 [Bryobacteraceae bacterium]|jgi:hypothetical protein|nr:hypothetical protein [Bryobacteraceae bacterium]
MSACAISCIAPALRERKGFLGESPQRIPHPIHHQEQLMAGRGPQSFKKRQKEQQRKERQQEKAQKREERKSLPKSTEDDLVVLDRPYVLPEFMDEPAEETEDAHSTNSAATK